MWRCTLVFVFVLASVSNGSALFASDSALVDVGVAQVDVTPSYPIRMTGYGSRKTESEGVTQRLWAKALALGNDQQGAAVLVTVDNCGISAATRETVAGRLAKKVGLEPERFVICASHTHTGPSLSDVLPFILQSAPTDEQRQTIDRYTAELIDALESVSIEALAKRAPARLAWAEGEVGFAMNRRVLQNGRWTGFGETPDGPVDHTLPILRVTNAEGKLRAVVVNYACHCTTLGGQFNQICGDWAGYAQEFIQRDHPGTVAMVTIGCGADSNPSPRNDLTNAMRHGETVAREVKRVLAGELEPLEGPLLARLKWIELPLDDPPTREEWEHLAASDDSAGHQARAALAMLDRGENLRTHVRYPVQTWSFGDQLAMVFLGGEVVVDYALRMKRELRGPIWATAYSNATPSYIPSRRVLAEGGYEADRSMVYYGQPARYLPEVEELIFDTVKSLLPSDIASDSP